MTRLHYAKKDIINLIVAAAAQGRYSRDKHTDDLPPIALEKFQIEFFRNGESALRALLSRLSRAELIGIIQEWADQQIVLLEQSDRKAAARAEQAERGRKHGLQPAILAAARYHRGLNQTAKQAWLAIERKPFRVNDEMVSIASDGDTEKMCVRSRNGRKNRNGITFKHWQDRYWPAAKP
jgi:hypothetical protein